MIVSRIQKLFYVSFLVSVAIVVLELYRCEFLLPFNPIAFTRDHLAGQLSRDDDSFLVDWCRLQRLRVDWEGLIQSCRHKMNWEHREVDSINRTDAGKSFISKWEIKPQGK